jgi:hypothetical protein
LLFLWRDGDKNEGVERDGEFRRSIGAVFTIFSGRKRRFFRPNCRSGPNKAIFDRLCLRKDITVIYEMLSMAKRKLKTVPAAGAEAEKERK